MDSTNSLVLAPTVRVPVPRGPRNEGVAVFSPVPAVYQVVDAILVLFAKAKPPALTVKPPSKALLLLESCRMPLPVLLMDTPVPMRVPEILREAAVWV